MDVNLSHLRNFDTDKTLAGITLTYLAACRPPAHRYITCRTATGVDRKMYLKYYCILAAVSYPPQCPYPSQS